MRGRGRIIIAIVGTLVACLILYWFFVKPQREELAEVRQQVEAEEIRTSQLRAELQRLQELQANAPELEAELAEIRGFVPTKPELANFIFQVQEAANRAGLDFVQITPALPEPALEAALSQVQADIVAVGGYFSLQDFLRRLYGMDRALRADTVTFTVSSLSPYGTRLSMAMTSRIFFEPVADAPTAVVTPGPTLPPSPTPTP